MTNTELAWLAGLLEGEGTFWFKQGAASLALNMIDRDVIEKAYSLMQATQKIHTIIRKHRNIKPSFYFAVCGLNAERIMKEILPLMGARRAAKIREIQSTLAHRRSTLPERRRLAGGAKWKTPGYREAHSGTNHWRFRGNRIGPLLKDKHFFSWSARRSSV